MKPVMELLKDFFIQRIILYCVVTFFGFFVLVPMGDLRIRFKDEHCSRCILYTDVVFVPPNFRFRFGEPEVCEYNIAVTSVFCLIYPLLAGVVYFFMYRRDSTETREENKLDLAHVFFLVHIVVEGLVFILILVSAGMITDGFVQLCDSITASPDGLDSCIKGETHLDWSTYDGSNFYVALSVATAGAWLVTVSWLLQVLLGLWKLWRLNMLPIVPSNLLCCKADE